VVRLFWITSIGFLRGPTMICENSQLISEITQSHCEISFKNSITAFAAKYWSECRIIKSIFVEFQSQLTRIESEVFLCLSLQSMEIHGILKSVDRPVFRIQPPHRSKWSLSMLRLRLTSEMTLFCHSSKKRHSSLCD
jgi:hypothetical protein